MFFVRHRHAMCIIYAINHQIKLNNDVYNRALKKNFFVSVLPLNCVAKLLNNSRLNYLLKENMLGIKII